jgi:alpha-tubulin suppressor-like RCC1 family protein
MNLQGRLGVAAASVACSVVQITSRGTITIPTTCSPSPIAVGTSVRFASLVAVSDATCGLDANGATYCWGSNDFAQLGTGGVVADTVPTLVPGAPTFTQLSAHDRGFCGLTSGGDIYCWGDVGSILGVPFQTCSTYAGCTPNATKVQVVPKFSTIGFTSGQLCGLSAGVAYCWGGDYHGALGINVTDNLPVGTPTQVSGQLP